MHAARSEIEPLGACRRHDMGGIAGEEQTPEALGSDTKERIGVTLFSKTGPVFRRC